MADPTPRARILIVEDEVIVAMDLASHLRDLGHEVVGIADNGNDAIRLVARWRPDLTLLDVRLKGPLDGVQVADVLAHEHDGAVLYLTSHSDAETVGRAARTGPLGYLTKPFDALQLRAAIEVALYKASTERRLRASEQRFRCAFEHAPLGMAMVSVEGNVQEANDALAGLLGISARSLAGRRIEDVVASENAGLLLRQLDDLRHGRAGLAQFEGTCRAPDAAGAGIPALVSVSLLSQEDAAAGWLYQVLDLTARHEAEQRLAALREQQARAHAAEMAAETKNRMLSRMSHELRTPLNAVLGFAQLLSTAEPLNDAVTAQYAGHILEAGRHLLSMVDDVLDLQGVESGGVALPMRRVALYACASESTAQLQPLARQQGIGTVVDIPEKLYVRADEDRLRQVLLQLGSNAIKYNRAGGSVTWRARPGEAGRVCLSVDDTGIGMSAESMAHLFEPFNRLGRDRSFVPGTGLGLLIARTLTQAMNGRLSITSEVDVGTSVCLELEAG